VIIYNTLPSLQAFQLETIDPFQNPWGRDKGHRPISMKGDISNLIF